MFGGLLLVGWLISAFSFLTLLDPPRFCVLYTFGNILAICSSFFLWGPCSQTRNMLKYKRLLWTFMYIFFLVMTLVAAFQGWNVLLVLFFAFCQFIASVLYFLSYIPYSRQMMTNCLSKLCCCKKGKKGNPCSIEYLAWRKFFHFISRYSPTTLTLSMGKSCIATCS